MDAYTYMYMSKDIVYVHLLNVNKYHSFGYFYQYVHGHVGTFLSFGNF